MLISAPRSCSLRAPRLHGGSRTEDASRCASPGASRLPHACARACAVWAHGGVMSALRRRQTNLFGRSGRGGGVERDAAALAVGRSPSALASLGSSSQQAALRRTKRGTGKAFWGRETMPRHVFALKSTLFEREVTRGHLACFSIVLGTQFLAHPGWGRRAGGLKGARFN